ncbi:MAG: PHP domain-containing protein [Vampirovibrionales bacterium]
MMMSPDGTSTLPFEPLARPIIDLHMHTTYSDGAADPKALVKAVAATGIKAFAVTDHDTTAGKHLLHEALNELQTDITLIPGIEINTHWQRKEVHILGYFIDDTHADLQAIMLKHRQARLAQAEAVIAKLRRHARVNLSLEDVMRYAHREGSVGRPHLARAIVQRGGAANISEAFKKYLNYESPTYIGRETASPHEAVEAIYESGGIAVVAHPADMQGFEGLVGELMNYGLMGIEAYHKSHTPAMMRHHTELAKQHGLIVTGGTDYHGMPEKYPVILQRLMMPLSVMPKLYEAKASRDKAVLRVV